MILLMLALGCAEAEATPSGLEGEVTCTTPGMNQLLDALDSRERAMDRREQSIDARESELRAVEEELKGRIEELENLRTELQTLMSEGDAQRNERVEALIKMTESMRGAQAAAVLEEMDQDLAVEVLDGMNRGKAGKALAAMPPAKAAELAEALTLSPLQKAALD